MKLIIFDMDGLMFDTEALGFRAYEECGKDLGLATGFPVYVSLIGKDERDTCRTYRDLYGKDFDAEEFYRIVGNRIQEIIASEGMPMKPGLLPLLDAIDEKGILKVIASSSNGDTIRDYLAGCGLEGRFDGVISSQEVERGKPHPDIFLEACRRMGTVPGEALVLEDSPAGIEAAAAGGIPVIAIPDLREIPEETGRKCLSIGQTLLDVIPFLS